MTPLRHNRSVSRVASFGHVLRGNQRLIDLLPRFG